MTNIEIDDKLMAQAMRASGLKTKRAVVEEALRLLVQRRRQMEVDKYFGKSCDNRHTANAQP